MERLEILGDAFLKYSVGLFFHYKLSNDVTSSEYNGRSYNEGDLSSARAQVVSWSLKERSMLLSGEQQEPLLHWRNSWPSWWCD